MTPEGRVKKKVNTVLKALGSECWRFMPVQTGMGAPALDYLLCYKGRFIAIETKAKGKKLTPLQERTKADMEAAGALVLVVDDDDSLAVALQIMLFERLDHGISKAKGQGEQHLRTKHSAPETDQATGRDHGAPREEPKRRRKPAPGGDDQRSLARTG